MAIKIAYEFPGLQRKLDKLDKLADKQSLAMRKAAYEWSEDTSTEAKRMTPVGVSTRTHRAGTLRSTVHAIKPKPSSGKDWETGISAGGPAAPYAVIVHEKPETELRAQTRARRRSMGTTWKYLEKPFKAGRLKLSRLMSQAMRQGTKDGMR